MPHVHFLYIGCGYWPQAACQTAWESAIGGRRARVDIREATGARRVGYYVAKYIGKLPDESSSLVIDAYLSNDWPGRKWGVLRKNLLPLCPRKRYRISKGEDWDFIRSFAKREWDGVPNDGEQGFTLFGDGAQVIAEFCADNALDEYVPEAVEQWDKGADGG